MDEEKLKLEDLLGVAPQKEEKERIDLVAIIGAGVMGQGIAQTVSSSGVDVLIVEKDEEHLNCAKQNLSEAMDREIGRWAMTKSEKKSILSRIKWTVDINDIADCDLVIEAVDEDLELKKGIFRQIDSIAHPSTILVSNTSTLSLTKIAEVTKRTDKIVGMHFLNPVPKIPLVELVKAFDTSENTLERVKEFAKRIGKTAVEVYEYPGFVTTRAIVPLLNEAMYILMEGVATAEGIDTAMKMGYNFPMGPLEMADAMGLDEVLAWMETLWKTLGEPRYRACPILRKLVREKKLGRKTGEGFYKYNTDGKQQEIK
ncbi:MAG: 3-hydroxyacyl-CoA dehydrogenase family protein [Bacteroidota bacterium]|jgi:3-hydroxybutyryl-CoA dehydrogenase|nr:NAD(P)-binding domain-containing protein [Ignavibacteria bacterium]MCU7498990.1 NAD(P)-binding domain-containing protein [Ignavibacteria bacterium]MCU7512435.1 NAD(P)-binding domain-containing protein [Ignavibacteria bacterium]MCU7518594.1 NAD(P)-binding domain-containing protein [Ignavibacteria bacterium]MCU7524278.1 NAD(P)-binding domain-containing protein [Ignavibacteria bacterium]